MSHSDPLFSPLTLGPLTLRNRHLTLSQLSIHFPGRLLASEQVGVARQPLHRAT